MDYRTFILPILPSDASGFRHPHAACWLDGCCEVWKTSLLGSDSRFKKEYSREVMVMLALWAASLGLLIGCRLLTTKHEP